MTRNFIRKIKLIPAWISEFFQFCPLRRTTSTDNKFFLVIGHRGSPGREVENTIPSFIRALNEGANGLEIDLSITKDGVVVLWHDWDPNDTVAILRESGFEPFVKYKPHPPAIGSEFRRKVSSLKLDEFLDNFDYKIRHGDTQGPAGAKIPTLTEFFEWAVRQDKLHYVFFDIKCPPDECKLSLTILERVKEHMEAYKPEFKAIIETADISVFNTMRNAIDYFEYLLDVEPRAGLILDPSEYSAVNAAIANKNSYALSLRPRKITIANWTTFRRIIRHDIRTKQEFNRDDNSFKIKKLICATISKPNELRCLVKMGIDGIQTDFPDKLRKIALRNKRVLSPEIKNQEYSPG